MKNLSIIDVIDAESSMHALAHALSEELIHVEACIEDLDNSSAFPQAISESVSRERERYVLARAAIHGGLASIADVMGWVKFAAGTSATNEVSASPRSSPDIPRFSIN